ncbi:hypothetical protein [Vibrio rumoiensis]|uniref:DUF2946 domain-containing protein n=1 Tax=Vibrio rumoiensis 1S-45 TaxID=1188252 RepID=A0A1E5E073_9VIBR|nr:hypothetical protein [Vibrio rumoiensis]OEF23891.1 hypothetical protein A1QC_01710 [Vibrio rumoiensis 1S-45]
MSALSDSIKLMMAKLWLVCWLLLAAMPVVNAHSGTNGVWETLCTLNGFKLVQIEGEADDIQPVAGSHCVFAHLLVTQAVIAKPYFIFQPFQHIRIQRNHVDIPSYHYRFEAPPRAPPALS